MTRRDFCLHHLLLPFICVLGLGYPDTGLAVPITFNFTGNATSTSGIFAGQGTAVTGSYTFEPDGLSLSSFVTTHTAAFAGSLGVFEISVTLGATTRTTANNQNTPATNHHDLKWQDGGFFQGWDDLFLFKSTPVILSDDFGQIFIRDNGDSVLPADGMAPGSGNLTLPLILAAPDVSLFNTVAGLSRYEARNGSGTLEGTLAFTTTSITAAPGAPGSDPGNPILPTSGGSGTPFRFDNVSGDGNWFDPPLVGGYEYATDGSSNFTEVGLPPLVNVPDADGQYLVSSVHGDQSVLAGNNYVFPSPVDFFTINGINPFVDGGDPLAFPTYLDFDQTTVTWTMTPIPEPSSVLLLAPGLVALVVVAARRHTAKSRAQSGLS